MTEPTEWFEGEEYFTDITENSIVVSETGEVRGWLWNPSTERIEWVDVEN